MPYGGCRGRCVYCSQAAITGISEIPSPEYVASVLDKTTEPVEVCYFGGSFCRFEQSTIEAYLNAVVRHAPSGSKIRFSTYPGDLKDKALRDFVLSYPISCIELGIPSLDPKVLAMCQREASPDATLYDLATLKNESVPIAVQMMIGLPGQTQESSIKDLSMISNIKKECAWQLRLYPCLVIEGTKLHEMMQRGEYTPLSVDEAVFWGGAFIDHAVSLGFIPIRIGLQESALLASSVRGGPHCPSLGEMILGEAASRALVRKKPRGPWQIDSKDISKFTGHSRFGIKRLAALSNMSEEDVLKQLEFY